jgi:ubiquinone/menaquinone biosynthesis C-methylase UbiE
MKETNPIFDQWPEKYDEWFETPIGSLVKKCESELILGLIKPKPDKTILDAGCGTGIFTPDLLSSGASVIGLDLSLPMLLRADRKLKGYPFKALQGNLLTLPFKDHVFDNSISITALEFIREGKKAVDELFRVTKKGGAVVVATLNSLSPWARRRIEAGKKGHPIFRQAIFRSPNELQALSPIAGTVRTSVHFQKEDPPDRAIGREREGQTGGWQTGAFIAIRWEIPE